MVIDHQNYILFSYNQTINLSINLEYLNFIKSHHIDSLLKVFIFKFHIQSFKILLYFDSLKDQSKRRKSKSHVRIKNYNDALEKSNTNNGNFQRVKSNKDVAFKNLSNKDLYNDDDFNQLSFNIEINDKKKKN